MKFNSVVVRFFTSTCQVIGLKYWSFALVKWLAGFLQNDL